MIHAKIHDADDVEIAAVWLNSAPRVGEYVWLTGAARERAQEKYGASSFVVTELAHWVHEEWSPSTHVGEPVHTLFAYVEPVTRESRSC